MYVKKMCLQPGLHLEPHWISLQLQCSPKLHRRLGRRQFPLPQHVWCLNSRHFPCIDSVPLVLRPAAPVLIVINRCLWLSSWLSHCESSAGSFDDYRAMLNGRQTLDQVSRLRPLISLNRQLWCPHTPFLILQPCRVAGWVSQVCFSTVRYHVRLELITPACRSVKVALQFGLSVVLWSIKYWSSCQLRWNRLQGAWFISDLCCR